MFKRSFRSQDRVEKAARLKKSNPIRSDAQKVSKLQQSLAEEATPNKRNLNSPIVTLTVGREGGCLRRTRRSWPNRPFLSASAGSKRISLPDEEPEIFSAVLEYLYKGDYYPRLLHNKHRNTWELEDTNTAAGRSPNPSSENGGSRGANEATIYISSVGQPLLRDTVVYCAADRYGLEELKRLSLRKQGLQSGIDVATILRSAQYAYDHTPDSDSRLRAHYLALIIRCRKTFKRSGTMQAEMEKGGKLFFDLFVAMCNHLDDVVDMSNARTPKTV
ncbi:hypothetical protein PG987_007091 [Apiospora arundinis]